LVPRIEEAAPERVAAVSAPLARAPVATARSAEDIFAAVSGSVALVVVGDAADRAISQGSAVVIGNGVAITNCHVVKGGSRIMLKAGTETRRATVAVSDEKYDLCRLDVPGLSAPPVEVGSVADVRTGQRVFAIGAPQGLNLTISDGIVSSLRDTEDGRLIQTTAPVSPGSSGGGLFNADGRLIGIVTFQYRGQNLNFAVPADWIAAMNDRGATLAASDPTIDEMVVGRWYCFGSVSGRNGEYVYGSDGIINVNYTDGRRNIVTRYQVSGRRVLYQIGSSVLSMEIESISRTRMVQLVGGGQRLACERR
jgi:S1-C subfamily serine protease